VNRKAAYEKYVGTQVKTSGSQNLMRMLHQGAIKFMNLADKCIEDHDLAEANDHLIRSQDIINEISLSFPESDDELAQNLRGLYAYMYRRLIEANVDKDTEKISEVRELVREMSGAWDEAANRSESERDGSIDVTG